MDAFLLAEQYSLLGTDCFEAGVPVFVSGDFNSDGLRNPGFALLPSTSATRRRGQWRLPRLDLDGSGDINTGDFSAC